LRVRFLVPISFEDLLLAFKQEVFLVSFWLEVILVGFWLGAVLVVFIIYEGVLVAGMRVDSNV
jgi:small basic protein